MIDSPALPHIVGRFTTNMSREQQQAMTEPKLKIEDTDTHHEDILKGDDAAAVAAAEEHSLSLQYVLRHNKRIVWWCFFFSLSAIGWYDTKYLSTFHKLFPLNSATN
jgi:hypothetical protein